MHWQVQLKRGQCTLYFNRYSIMWGDDFLTKRSTRDWIASKLTNFFFYLFNLHLYIQFIFSFYVLINLLDFDTEVSPFAWKWWENFCPTNARAPMRAQLLYIHGFWTSFVFMQSSRCHLKHILIPCRFRVMHFQLYILVMKSSWN